MKAAEAASVDSEIREVAWIRGLARPYLKGFAPARETAEGLHGYLFSRPAGRAGNSRVGFFLGFLVSGDRYRFLDPHPPECLVFAFVHPPRGALHRRLVSRPASLLRSTHTYISWLTHHTPRFQFSDAGPAALARHLPLARWPEGRRAHYARNFFIESLAWLVRSGLVRRLAAETQGKQTA
ncbi:MAG TPA: hypothetical protein VGS20_02315 [Candidatus Acidoferrales bacterium]|nr:hypothetical protein [Candidatus Acidoferrales bacterium]